MNEAINALYRKIHPIGTGKYLLGLSGGADSVALLMMIMPAIRDKTTMIEAVHINHGLRGSESDDDERFCSCLCKKTGIPLYVYRANLDGRTDESSAREARYAFFRKRYAESHADGLILAHQADDQAETFLMRLLRGAGADGLECMKEDETVGDIRILRPMLSLRREEIRKALQADGIPWREDTSNQDTAYLRNRIRHELIPTMCCISGMAVEKICQAAALTGEDNALLNTEASDVLARVSSGWLIDAEELAKEQPALRKRVLRLWWHKYGISGHEHSLNTVQTQELDRLLNVSKGKINLPGGKHAIRDGKYLFLPDAEKPEPLPVNVTGTETMFGRFRLTETLSEGNPGDGKKSQEVPADFIRNCVIRTRQPGDRIHPFGSTGSKKLQDYLTDRKIAEPFRDHIPLLCRGSEVLLVCGVGAGNIPYWKPDVFNVRLTWHGDMPWID